MNTLTFASPVFRVYSFAAAAMVAKMMTQSWITVYRMLKVNAGFRMAEDTRKSPMNPHPSPEQLLPNEYVERSRRMHLNEVENVPLFLAIGLLYVCTAPSFASAAALFGGYVVSRLVHFYILMTGRMHESRAAAWTVGSAIIYVMVGVVILQAVRGAA